MSAPYDDSTPTGQFPPVSPPPLRARRGKWWLVALGIVLVGGVAGGVATAVMTTGHPSATGSTTPGGSSSSGHGPPPIGTGYLSVGSTEVDFIQWNDTNGYLSGSIQIATIVSNGDGSETLDHETDSVAGQTHGSSISLSFDGGNQLFGQWNGGSFTIDVPQSDGTLAPVTFDPAPAARFNQAVAVLSGHVDSNNQALAQAQQQEKQQQAIDNDVQAVNGDLSQLQSDESDLGSDVASVGSSLQTAANDLSSTQTAEGQTTSCGDAFTVGGDAFTVSGDAFSVGGAADTVQSMLNSLRGTLSTLSSDFSQLQSAEQALPGYLPSGTPSQGDISQAISTAQAAISQAIATTNADIDQANADVTSAYAIAGQAYQVANCGAGPTAPSPIQHVS